MKRIFGVAVVVTCALVGCNEQKNEGALAIAHTRPGTGPILSESTSDVPVGVQATNRATRAQGDSIARNTAMSAPRFNSTLPAERDVISGSGLSVAKVTRIIRTREFEKFLDQLRSEADQDPLAQDATTAQGDVIRKQLDHTAALRDFSCGLSVCAGIVELGKTPSAYDRFADAYLAGVGQTGSLLDYRVDLGGGRFEQRFVMSYDPAVNGITFPGSGHK
jgi:hypothetical protein